MMPAPRGGVDQRPQAGWLSHDEARFLVLAYHPVWRLDDRFNRAESYLGYRQMKGPGSIGLTRKHLRRARKEIAEELLRFVMKFRVGRWLLSVPGMHPLRAADFLVTFSPLAAKGFRSYHALAGLIPKQEALKTTWNVRAKWLALSTARSLSYSSSSYRPFYGDVFRGHKASLEAANAGKGFAGRAKKILEAGIARGMWQRSGMYKRLLEQGTLPAGIVEGTALLKLARTFLKHWWSVQVRDLHLGKPVPGANVAVPGWPVYCLDGDRDQRSFYQGKTRARPLYSMGPSQDEVLWQDQEDGV